MMDERTKLIDWAARNHETKWAALSWLYDSAVAEERSRWRELVGQLIACHEDSTCPAVDLARDMLARAERPVMQRPVAQQAHEALHHEKKLLPNGKRAELQALCTLAAQHIPIVVSWSNDTTPRPWGCILGPREQNPRYCDLCPAREICPHEYKEWSK